VISLEVLTGPWLSTPFFNGKTALAISVQFATTAKTL